MSYVIEHAQSAVLNLISALPRPRVLDAFCGHGGAGMGYRRAGFSVLGVDKQDFSEVYPFTFVQGDAVHFIRTYGWMFDLTHTSPPCQANIAITAGNRARDGWVDDHADLVPDTRAACESAHVPYVIENGKDSKAIRPDVTLCGLSFRLPTFRLRGFELGGWPSPREPHISHVGHLTIGWRHGCLRTTASAPELCPLHMRWCEGTVYGVYGKGGRKPTVPQAQRALGIDWTDDLVGLNEAIPPAYTEWLGHRFRESRELGRAA